MFKIYSLTKFKNLLIQLEKSFFCRKNKLAQFVQKCQIHNKTTIILNEKQTSINNFIVPYLFETKILSPIFVSQCSLTYYIYLNPLFFWQGTIVSIFNEASPLGKQYVFDIRRTCREVHDNARRAMYQPQSATPSDGSTSQTSERLARLLDALTCRS